MCPGKSRQSWTSAKPQHTVRERSQDAIISPSSPPEIFCSPMERKKKRARVSKRKRQTKQNRRACKRSLSTLALCNQQGEREERQCRTSGFHKGDHCPLSGPLHQLLKDCLSTAGPFKPPANPCQARFPLSSSGRIYNPTEQITHQFIWTRVLFHRGSGLEDISAHRRVETNRDGLPFLMVPYPAMSGANWGASSL